MLQLAQNSVIRIEAPEMNGLYRVIAEDPAYPDTFLFRLQEAQEEEAGQSVAIQKVPRALLEALPESGKLERIELVSAGKHLLPPERLSERERVLYEFRRKVMRRFLDARDLTRSYYLTGGIAPLAKQAMADTKCARSTVYSLFRLLCQYGFDSGSLNPRFDRCGAPEVKRPAGPNRCKAGRKSNAELLGANSDVVQPGCGEEWIARVLAADTKIRTPKPRFNDRYQIIIQSFSPGYRQTDQGVERIPPLKGTYPNRRQVRYLLNQYPLLKRLRQSTTTGHFNRNIRGLRGRSWEGVAGPGHTFAMDSTIGDIYLRSQVNRAWIIGRPIVYFLVDVWSTAIVGFHVCLSGPSWDMAKLGIFSATASTDLLVGLWGVEGDVWSLNPAPGLPYLILGDRGEYLSAGASETAISLGFNFDYAASYRPDMKGMVEVLHRIAKDQQYFFVPGAMDARRKEMELRIRKETSAYTLPEYVNYLAWRVQLYNLHADRNHRLDTTMISAGVHPSPAGLWRFGFETGIGYRKETATEKLITHLLPLHSGAIRRDGIFLGRLEYRSDLARAEEWTTLARHAGAMEIPLHCFPGSLRQVWTPHPHSSGLLELTLSDQAIAPGNLSVDEYLDAQMYQSRMRADLEHESVTAMFHALERIEAQARRAKILTRAADEEYSGAKPTITEARQIEAKTHDEGIASAMTATQASNSSPLAIAPGNEMSKRSLQYAGLMDQILGGLAP